MPLDLGVLRPDLCRNTCKFYYSPVAYTGLFWTQGHPSVQCAHCAVQCAVCSFRAASGSDECILGVVISAEIARAHFSLRQLHLFTAAHSWREGFASKYNAGRLKNYIFLHLSQGLTASLNLLHLSSWNLLYFHSHSKVDKHIVFLLFCPR